MQSVSSRIWTHVDVSISYDNNHYTTGTSLLFTIKLYLHLICVLILNWIIWNRTIFIKMDLALYNLQTQTTNQPNNIYLICKYKEDLVLDELKWLICHKNKPNQIKLNHQREMFRGWVVVLVRFPCMGRTEIFSLRLFKQFCWGWII